LAAVTNTTKQDDGSIIVTNNNKMTDASYDHEANKVFTAGDRQTAAGGSFEEAPSGWKVTKTNADSTTSEFYYAVQWRMTFAYTYGSVPTTTNLYFDPTVSQIAKNGTDPNTYNGEDAYARDSIKGFRIAFANSDGNGDTTADDARYVIWADQRSLSDTVTKGATETDEAFTARKTAYDAAVAESMKYIKDATSPAEPSKSAYAATVGVINADNKASLEGPTGTPATTNAHYLGTFPTGNANEKKTISLLCTAWFEGNDAAIINNTMMYPIAATLGFFIK